MIANSDKIAENENFIERVESFRKTLEDESAKMFMNLSPGIRLQTLMKQDEKIINVKWAQNLYTKKKKIVDSTK